MSAGPAVRSRHGARAGLLVLTLAAVLAARPPDEGAAVRAVCVAALIAGSGLVVWLSRRDRLTRTNVLLLAATLRLVALPLPPTLSDDAYRYVWDGMVQAHLGENPYRFRPSDPALARVHADPLYERLNSPDYFSVYPPASQLGFMVSGAAYGWGWEASYYAIKGLVTAAEVAGIALLLQMAPPASVVLYAWHPLAVMEVSGQGHSDGLAVGALLMGVWALARKRPLLAGAGIALAGWVKLVPLLLLPVVARRAGARSVLAAALVLAATALPFAAPYTVPHVRESLDLYVRSFEFGAGPYEAMKAVAAAMGMGDVSKSLGPWLRGAFLLGALGLILRDARRSPPFAASASALFGAFLACATTVHPWYLLPGLALAPLLRAPGVWVWAASVAPATYLVYVGGEGVYGLAVALGWGGAALLLLAPRARGVLDGLLRRRAGWKWRWIAPHVPTLDTRSSVLDLGAGEGFVGERAAQATGARVVLADVSDANRTNLEYVVTDGRTLPFADGAFDVVLLVYVLHHAEDPERLVAEASRVCRGQLVVVESVPEPGQRWLTEGIDRWVNRLRGRALPSQEAWLRMRPSVAWRATFRAAGLEVVAEARRGRLVHPQSLMVLQRTVIANQDRPIDTTDADGTR